MKVIKQTGTANTTSLPGRKIDWFAIHYTAGVSCKAGAASGCAAWFAKPEAGGSADYICDERDLIQYNPDPLNRYCHAVGGGKYATKGGRLYGIAKNSNTVSLEICSGNLNGKITYPNDPAYYFTAAVIAKAQEAAQYIMDLYHIPPDHVIRHYDVNGKPCPGIIGWNEDSGDESKWFAFHESLGGAPIKWYRVRYAWDQPETQLGAYVDVDNAKACADAHPGFSVYDEDGKNLYTSKPSEKPVEGDYSPDAWISMLAHDAVAVAAKNDLLASVMLAQASLETGWGKTDLAKRHNIFGMKADLINSTWKEWSVWDGKTYEKYSPEEYNGVVRQVKSAFRVYDSYRQCMEDYAAFLLHVRNNKGLKYARIQGMRDPAEVIHAIRIGTGTDAHPEGYATDSGYETKVLNLIKKYNLTKYDTSPKPDIPTPEEPDDKKIYIYRVQIEADKNKKTAEKTCKTCKQATGYDCFYELGTDGFYRVFCGSFRYKENAEDRVNQIKDDYPTAFVVKRGVL